MTLWDLFYYLALASFCFFILRWVSIFTAYLFSLTALTSALAITKLVNIYLMTFFTSSISSKCHFFFSSSKSLNFSINSYSSELVFSSGSSDKREPWVVLTLWEQLISGSLLTILMKIYFTAVLFLLQTKISSWAWGFWVLQSLEMFLWGLSFSYLWWSWHPGNLWVAIVSFPSPRLSPRIHRWYVSQLPLIYDKVSAAIWTRYMYSYVFILLFLFLEPLIPECGIISIDSSLPPSL